MKQTILHRIKELGGNVDKVGGNNLKDDLLSITFDTVLYQRPQDTAWTTAEDQEPIYGMGDFVDENIVLFNTDKTAFYDKLANTFFCLTDKPFGQTFWEGRLFTPFKKGTPDFEEWNDDFTDDEMTNLEIIVHRTQDSEPDFIQLFYDYGHPSDLYIALSDPDPENPTVFGTDHTEFFNDITNQGSLEEYLNTFMTQEELVQIVKNKLEQ